MATIEKNIGLAIKELASEPGLATPMHAIEGWAAMVQDVCFPRCSEAMVAHAMKQVLTIARAIEKPLPQWEHFLNDTKYSKQLCKKHLLQHPKRATFGSDVMKLWKSISDLTDWAGKLLGRPLGEVERFEEDTSVLENILDKARATVYVTAACAVVQEMKGEQAHRRALELVQNEEFKVPKTLLDAVKGLASQAPTDDAAEAQPQKKQRTDK